MSEMVYFLLAFDAIAVGILLILVIAFLVFSRLFSGASGWSSLAARYPASQQPQGVTFTHQHMRMGMVRYRNATTIVAGPAGLYLAVIPILTKHPPLLIPWQAISGVRSTRIYWLGAKEMAIGSPPIAKIAVLNGVFEAMQPYLDH